MFIDHGLAFFLLWDAPHRTTPIIDAMRTTPHAYITIHQKPAEPIGFPSVALLAEFPATLPAASLTV